jgi:hypothetical protein
MLGIRKDLIDTKKAKLEVKKLQHEERTRNSLITPATFDDVVKYDPKIHQIGKKVGSKRSGKFHARYESLEEKSSARGCLISLTILFLLILISLLIQKK